MATNNPPKDETKKPLYLSVSKGYKSPIDEKTLKSLVDYESESYAFLELESRSFDPGTGKKVSSPRIVSFNRKDLDYFLRTEEVTVKDEKGKDVQKTVCEGRNNLGSVNAVAHVPKSWNLEVECDEWPK